MNLEASGHRGHFRIPRGNPGAELHPPRPTPTHHRRFLLSSGEAGPARCGRRLSRKKNATNLMALPCGHSCPPSPASG